MGAQGPENKDGGEGPEGGGWGGAPPACLTSFAMGRGKG